MKADELRDHTLSSKVYYTYVGIVMGLYSSAKVSIADFIVGSCGLLEKNACMGISELYSTF